MSAGARLLLAVLLAVLACGPGAGPPAAAPAARPAPAGAASPAPNSTLAGASAALPAATSSAPWLTAPPSPEHVRIAYPATATSFLTLYVAQDQGYYARYGIDAEVMMTAAAVAITGMTTGDMDFTMSLGSAARAAAQGLPVRVVEQSGTAPQLYVVGQPELRSLADLRGKVLSSNSISGTTGQTAIMLMRKAGVGRAEFELVPGGDAPRQMEMLRQRQIDAALFGPPFPLLAGREGYPLLASAPDEIQLAFAGLATSQDALARRGDMVRRVIAAEVEALRYVYADRAGAIRAIVDHYDAEPDVAAQTYDLIIGSFSRDGSLPRDGVEAVLALDKEDGAIPESVRYEDVVDPRPVQDVQRALGIAP
ncbi:MAG TPA: ABC transporter substrate-binding protein [Chloroflexota bacterium]|jgi:NitT/TauT family transport system substrate-binding protein